MSGIQLKTINFFLKILLKLRNKYRRKNKRMQNIDLRTVCCFFSIVDFEQVNVSWIVTRIMNETF